MVSDYSDWIISIPLLGEKDLFPSFSDGCDVAASVVNANALFIKESTKVFPGAWFDLASRPDIQSPNGFADELPALVKLRQTMELVIRDLDWRVPS